MRINVLQAATLIELKNKVWSHSNLWLLLFHMTKYFLPVLVGVILLGCNGTELKEPLEYKGPLSEFENVELYYSENDKVKVKMLADLLYEFESGDREFP
jgi:hypothetical protein